MKKRQFITLRAKNSNEEVDIELPSDRPIGALIPEMLKVLNWPQSDDGHSLQYRLENEEGEIVNGGKTFFDAGIENFDTFWIILDEVQKCEAENQRKAADPVSRIPDAGTDTADDSKDRLLPYPLVVHLPIERPCLVSDEGIIFILGETPILIGRKGKNAAPQIDLSLLDKGLISSHSHAEIVRTGHPLTLKALNTKNGMLINGNVIAPGQMWTLRDGDELQFGFRGVQLTFRQPVES